jgi:5'(3')-deoxyribonucleotidase
MSDITHIFLDIDGVCADFYQQMVDTFSMDLADTLNDKEALRALDNGAPFKGVFKHPTPMLWREITQRGEGWWSDIPEVCCRFHACPSTRAMFESLNKLAPTVFLTGVPGQPDSSPPAASGKLQWLQRIFGNEFTEVIICDRKSKPLLAATGCVLIDDYESNCEEFVAAGGHALLFRPKDVTGMKQIIRAVEKARRADVVVTL